MHIPSLFSLFSSEEYYPRRFEVKHTLQLMDLALAQLERLADPRVLSESLLKRIARALDVSTRGAFYEGVGAIRDVIENHMFQLVTLLAMDPFSGRYDDALRDEKPAS